VSANYSIRPRADTNERDREMKKALIAGLALTAALVMAIPAHAAGVVATTNAQATLPVFPGSGSVSALSGNVTGVGTGQPSGALSLGSVSYNETTCAVGSASGTINIGSTTGINLQWNRVGAVAVLRLNGNGQTGVAAALFVANATDARNDCVTAPGPMHATIIAAGVAEP